VTDVQSATVQRVKVIFGEDDDAYVVDGTGHELENDDNEFVADVPTELWITEQDTYRAWRRASAAVIEAVGVDVEEHRLIECCPRWKGYTTPASEHWDVYVARPDSERGDRRIGWESTEEAAQAIIDALPEVFYEHGHGSGYREIHRDWLRVEKAGWAGTTSNCYRCGWDRTEHADQGDPTPPKPFPSVGGDGTMNERTDDHAD
jgi:hypothetical protein